MVCSHVCQFANGVWTSILSEHVGTTDVQVHSFIYKHTRRVFLVDTPGFDDSERGETQILKDIALFLSQIYKRKILLTGIIYLHRITDRRMSGSSIRNLDMFKALCGEDAYKHVVLATTMWEQVDLKIGEQRENELKSKPDYWGYMISKRQQSSEAQEQCGICPGADIDLRF